MRHLTHNQLTEVREACEQLSPNWPGRPGAPTGNRDVTMDTDEGYLVISFPNHDEQGLELFAEFVLLVDHVSMDWGLGNWFAKGARTVCHDSNWLEVRFDIAYGESTDILPNYRMHCTVCGHDSDDDARGFCGDCETCDEHCTCEATK